MCDKLVFDLSQEIEGSPNVFVRKDWINILDNQNGNYQSNQCIIDTSQLSNSNKYMAYREAYLAIPLTLSVATSGAVFATGTAFGNVAAATNPVIATNFGNTTTPVSGVADFSMGLKNWFGTVIHSFTCDYNGTTIIQQTPFCNMWNIFKLLTTLSYNDIISIGSTIGFYPDDPNAFSFNPTASCAGNGTCNNMISALYDGTSSIATEGYGGANPGLLKRISNINYDVTAPIQDYQSLLVAGTPFSSLFGAAQCTNLWRSYISSALPSATGVRGYMQISIMGTIYLKHLHSFFNMAPLLKGVFMKLTMNLNNASCVVQVGGTQGIQAMYCASATVPVGGVNPIMIPSSLTPIIGQPVLAATIATATAGSFAASGTYALSADTYTYDLSVGQTPLSAAFAATGITAIGRLSRSILLYVPAYTFNPVFEQAYLSSPIKQIKYTDIYQYQVLNIAGTNGTINNLITNGIANIKSVLIIPFFSAGTTAALVTHTTAIATISADLTLNPSTGLIAGMPVYQSPFDTAGCGTSSPLCHLSNFNVQISGQNAIYNMQRYGFEQFNDQLYGQNSVNGGLTDGLTSGLIDYLGFQNSQCYYYVNVERMLPVEQSVPKSVQVIGTNNSVHTCDYWVFVEYGVEVSVDLLTGARV